MTGRRIIRGFKRLGAVVAVPLWLIACAFIVVAGIAKYNQPPPIPAAAAVLERPNSSKCYINGVDYSACMNRYQIQWDAYLEREARKAAIDAPFNDVVYAAIAAGAGAFWFVLCWAVGWMLAGFARDEA
jgi:hypothetical protein